MMDPNRALLLVVDMQEKLLRVMDQPAETTAICQWLVAAAQKLGMPILFSEQYRQGLGPTVESLSAVSPLAPRLEKMSFSCWRDEQMAESMRPFSQFVLVGIEAHICVLQTALDLVHTASRSVYVVESGIDSRYPADKALAIERMRQNGVQIISPEMFLYEGLKSAEHPDFKSISKVLIRPKRPMI